MRAVSTLLLTIVLTACSGSGSEYVGQWQNGKRPDDKIEIVRNGDNFLVKNTVKSMFGKGKLETHTFPAALKDGQLQISTSMGSTTLTHVKESDKLIAPTMMGSTIEYKRVEG